MTHVSPLQDERYAYSYEGKIHWLWTLVQCGGKRDDRKAMDLHCHGSVQIFDVGRPPKQADRVYGDRAQFARCIYCGKSLASWSAVPKGKRAKMRSSPSYEVMAEWKNKHIYACSEAWTWDLLARWALSLATESENAAIGSWAAELEHTKNEELRRQRQGNSDYVLDQIATTLLGTFDQLPSRDPAIHQAIEIGLMLGPAQYFPRFDPSVTPIQHGIDERNPHVFLPTQFGDAEHGKWGMCPCGQVEWRGEISPHDRLIGWSRTMTGARNVRHIPSESTI